MKIKEIGYFYGMFIGAVSVVGYVNHTKKKRQKALAKEGKSS